jgi:D-threonate/D-erythronate kinase
MIVVIADDITGAAELAGIGLRYGLSILISDDVNFSIPPEMLVVYTNARSMPKDKAVITMRDITQKIQKLPYKLLYKKIDSVLRGHIVAEVKAQMQVLNLDQTLLVPANPDLGRIISGGQYYIHSRPLHTTSFAADPEFPINSSNVKELLNERDIYLCSPDDSLPHRGIVIGEASTTPELERWAVRSYSRSVLTGGGASFFDAILAHFYGPKKSRQVESFEWKLPSMLVSGTSYYESIKRIKEHHAPASTMPGVVYNTVEYRAKLLDWYDEVITVLQKENKTIVAIGEQGDKPMDHHNTGEKLAELASLVNSKFRISEWLIEGGDTAFRIVQKLDWHSFVPLQELEQGIVRMSVLGQNDVYLTIKPGSYQWPHQWPF